VAALDTGVAALWRELRFAGQLFEPMVTRDLQVDHEAITATELRPTWSRESSQPYDFESVAFKKRSELKAWLSKS